VQYASEDYGAVLERHGMIPSMSRPANPYDNASCESFLKTLKREEIYANQYRDLDHLRANIEEFIDRYYNQQRLHSALGYRSPEEFERHANHADPRTQLCSPSLEFFPGSEEKTSTRMLEQGIQDRPLLQTSSPASNERPKPNSMARVSFKTVSRCGFTPWVHPITTAEKVCRRMCRTLRADVRQCGLFRYFDKVLPCGLGCG